MKSYHISFTFKSGTMLTPSLKPPFLTTQKHIFSCRYIECFIAEQNLVGVGIGAACRDRTVAFVSTFAAFFTRAFDQLRMGAISQVSLELSQLFYSILIVHHICL